VMRIKELQSSSEAHEMRLIDRNHVQNTEQALKANNLRDEVKRKGKKKERHWNQKQGYSLKSMIKTNKIMTC